jgi:Gpi18-like mannosyltransferase
MPFAMQNQLAPYLAWLRNSKSLFWVGFLLALGVRLWLAPLRGHVHDIEQFKAWTQTAVQEHPLAIYSQSTANYPPLGLLPLIGAGYVYRLFFSPDFDLSSTTLTVVLKLPAIAADLITAVALYRWVQRKRGRSWATAVAFVYALNPAGVGSV